MRNGITHISDSLSQLSHKQLNVEHESETRINLIDEADKLVNEIYKY